MDLNFFKEDICKQTFLEEVKQIILMPERIVLMGEDALFIWTDLSLIKVKNLFEQSGPSLQINAGNTFKKANL